MSEEKLTIGEKLILDEMQRLNGHLCDIKERLDNKYASQSVLVQTAQALQSQINQKVDKDNRVGKDKAFESKGLSTLEIGKLEDLPDGILDQFNIGKGAKS